MIFLRLGGKEEASGTEYKCTVAPILAPVQFSLFVCLGIFGLCIPIAFKPKEKGGLSIISLFNTFWKGAIIISPIFLQFISILHFRDSGPFCFCFPFWIRKIKITLFHFLLSCTIIFTLLWGFVIYSCINTAFKQEHVPSIENNIE